jgi:hypothetical protein
MPHEGGTPAGAADGAVGAANSISATIARVSGCRAGKSADAEPRRAEQAASTTARLAPQDAPITAAPTGRSAETELATLPSWALAELFKAEGAFARVWVELVSIQMACNAETLQRLAATRGWREAVPIHQEFVRDNLARVADAVDRCLVLQHELVTRVLAAAGEERSQQVA